MLETPWQEGWPTPPEGEQRDKAGLQKSTGVDPTQSWEGEDTGLRPAEQRQRRQGLPAMQVSRSDERKGVRLGGRVPLK